MDLVAIDFETANEKRNSPCSIGIVVVKIVRLNTVNNFLGYKFQHHDALADAMACSNILLYLKKRLLYLQVD